MPAEGMLSSEMFASFQVTVSEPLVATEVNTPVYEFAEYQGRTYALTDSSQTWEQADVLAQALGGQLVSIGDEAEQVWTESTFSGVFWIGLSDVDLDNVFEWASSEPLTYTNWGAGWQYSPTPDHYNYVGMYSDGRWFNWDSNDAIHPALIEGVDTTDTDLDRTPDVLDLYPASALNNWDLRAAGPDGEFDTVDDDVYDLRVWPPYEDGTTIDLQVFDGHLHEGAYRLTISPVMTDLVGNALDGNSDGSGGDSYVQVFQVDLPEDFVYEGRQNESMAEATALILREDPAESGLFITDVMGIGSIDPLQDADWWHFEAELGDLVAVSMETPRPSGVPYSRVTLSNAAGDALITDNRSGPTGDAFISRFIVPESGSYFLRCEGDNGYYTGSYQLRVELARGIDLESDASNANDSISGADPIVLVDAGIHRGAP